MIMVDRSMLPATEEQLHQRIQMLEETVTQLQTERDLLAAQLAQVTQSPRSRSAPAERDARADVAAPEPDGAAMQRPTPELANERVVHSALRDQNDMYRAMFEQNRAIKLLIDPESGMLVDANPAAAAFYGYPVNTLRTMRIFDMNTLPEPLVRANMRKALHGECQFFAFQHRTASDDVRDVEVYSGVIPVQGKALLYSIIYDCTERKRAEAALRASEAKYRSLFDSIPVGIYRVAVSGELLEINQAAVEMLGYPNREILLAEHMNNLYVDPDEHMRWCDLIERYGVVRQFEMRLRRYDGSVIWASNNAHGVRDAGGTIQMYEGSISDITCRKEMEQALRESEARYQELARQNAERYHVEHQRVAILNTLRTTLAHISSELDLSALLQTMLEHAAHLLRATSGMIGLYDEQHQQIIVHASYNLAPDAVGTHRALGEGVLGTVAQSREPLIISDYPGWQGRVYGNGQQIDLPQTVVAVPLLQGDNLVGAISVGDVSPHRVFTPADVELLLMFAQQAVVAIQNAHLFAEVQHLATTDPLTGLLNRRHFFDLAYQAFHQTTYWQHPVSVVMLDIDNFKRINDTYGHSIGDEVLQFVAAQCRASLSAYQSAYYDTNLIGRYGGEEMVLLLPGIDLPAARQLAEHIRASLEQAAVVVERAHLSITASLGIATRSSGDTVLLEALIDRADQMLYAAKRLGKNQVVAWGDTAIVPDASAGLSFPVDAFRPVQSEALHQVYEGMLSSWIALLQLRDPLTHTHTMYIVDMTVRLAVRLGMREPALTYVRWGTLLHDIGKLALPDAILKKSGPLTDEELLLMRLHPLYAYDLLMPIEFLRPALDIPYCHHERWDGTGYPRGLHAEAIPLAARIFAVVDVWDALRSDRPYRPAWSDEAVIGYIRDYAGIHFDPQVVGAFLTLIQKEQGKT